VLRFSTNFAPLQTSSYLASASMREWLEDTTNTVIVVYMRSRLKRDILLLQRSRVKGSIWRHEQIARRDCICIITCDVEQRWSEVRALWNSQTVHLTGQASVVHRKPDLFHSQTRRKQDPDLDLPTLAVAQLRSEGTS
jgi:hypothetical protein